LAGTGTFDRIGDVRRDGVGDRAGKLALQPGCRSEMMEKVGVRPADLARDGLQGHCLRPLLDQQLARCRKRGGPAFFGGEAGPSY